MNVVTQSTSLSLQLQETYSTSNQALNSVHGNGGAMKKIQYCGTLLIITIQTKLLPHHSRSTRRQSSCQEELKQLSGPRCLTSQMENRNLSVHYKKNSLPILAVFLTECYTFQF